MIIELPQSQGNFLGIKASEKLTHRDYQDVLIPRLEAILQSHSKARLLYWMDENFTGWELGAMWDDTKFGIKHKNDFDKVAIVGGPTWVEKGARFFAHFMAGEEVKTFPLDQHQAALDWITQ